MNRLDEIEKEMEELEEILEKKKKEWDYSKQPMDYWYEKYIEYIDNESSKINELDREKRMIQPYKLSELPDYGTVMSLNEFIDYVNYGSFIDYDGYGNYVKDNQKTNIHIYPSDVEYGAIRKEFDKIIWFNR